MSTPRKDRSRHAQIDELYRDLAPNLERMTAAAATTSVANIQDACAIAWTKLARRPDIDLTVRPRVVGWLRTVAVHEAWHLEQQDRRHSPLNLDAECLQDALLDPVDPQDRIIGLERMRYVLQTMPPRQLEAFMLHLAGYTYSDIAHRLNVTLRVVNRRMVRARAHIREVAER